MLINKRTNEPSLNTEDMKVSNMIEIKTILDKTVKNLDKSSNKGLDALETLKTHIYIDYIDSETGEEITDFHPNMYALYSDDERLDIKDFIINLEVFVTKYDELKKTIPSLFDPIARLEALG